MRKLSRVSSGWWRGVRLPTLLSIVGLWTLGAAVSWAQSPPQKRPASGTPATEKPIDLPTGEQIMDKTIEAQGGKAALEKLHARIQKCTFEIVGQNAKGPLTIYSQAPNLQRVELNLGSVGTQESGFDGTVCWEITSAEGPRIITGEELDFMLRQGTFNAELKWREYYERADCTGIEDVDGRSCYKVVLTAKKGRPETRHYERKTGLLIRVEGILPGARGDMPFVSTQSDFRKVDGVMIAHTSHTTLGGGVQSHKITVTSVEHPDKIPAEKFELPDQIKALVEKAKKKDADKQTP